MTLYVRSYIFIPIGRRSKAKAPSAGAFHELIFEWARGDGTWKTCHDGNKCITVTLLPR